MTVREAVAAAAARLAAVSDTPLLDAELLMAHALGVEREALLLSHASDPAPDTLEPLLLRRLAHEPIAYILGTRGFWTIDLEVGPGVLVPRPDTETLLDAAVARFGKTGPKTILDLGTGSGALLLAALDQWPGATGHGRDASPEALAIAARNADRLGLSDRAAFSLGDWGEGLPGSFDLILCNPPYVETGADLPPDVRNWEPHRALFAGPDGLDDYRRLAPEIARLLALDGLACIEIGHEQAGAAGALFAAQGLRVALRKDLAGRDRCLVLSR
ncbi:MAG TPA: peptide chain release factor N(5)-glutamine methyltransferase [Allosphingosinicella sp.]|jgi:release factor glutamine methyltransferase